MIRNPVHTNLMETIIKLKNDKRNTRRQITPRKKVLTTYYNCQLLSAKSKNIFNGIINKCVSSNAHFTRCEIKMLLLLFQEMVGDVEGQMKEITFRDFLINQFDIKDIKSLNSIIKAFKTHPRSKKFSAHEFIMGLSTFVRGTLDDRINFTFKGYDYDFDGLLRRKDEFFRFLYDSFDQNSEAIQCEVDPDEPYRETVNYLMSKYHSFNDVNIQVFKQQCIKNPLLMECLAPIFPSESKTKLFQQLLCSKIYTPSYLNLKNPS